MEHHDQPRGAPSEISPGADEPVPLPQTFAEAEQRNPFELLTQLHDHAVARLPHEHAVTSELAELALSAAVVAWWSRWQPLTIHRALTAGASLIDVAAALGTTEVHAYERWSQWADTQSRLMLGQHTAIARSEVDAIRSRIRHT